MNTVVSSEHTCCLGRLLSASVNSYNLQVDTRPYWCRLYDWNLCTSSEEDSASN